MTVNTKMINSREGAVIVNDICVKLVCVKTAHKHSMLLVLLKASY